MNKDQAVDRLLSILSADEVPPAILASGLAEFDAETKKELVARIAHTFEPAPPGRLLARLPFLLTTENQADMVTAFIVNLHSPDPAARKASLYGLAQLGYPGVGDFALPAIRDPDDSVVAAACDILLARAEQYPTLRELLQGLYAAHKGKAEFYVTTSLLQAHHIDAPGSEG